MSIDLDSLPWVLPVLAFFVVLAIVIRLSRPKRIAEVVVMPAQTATLTFDAPPGKTVRVWLALDADFVGGKRNYQLLVSLDVGVAGQRLVAGEFEITGNGRRSFPHAQRASGRAYMTMVSSNVDGGRVRQNALVVTLPHANGSAHTVYASVTAAPTTTIRSLTLFAAT